MSKPPRYKKRSLAERLNRNLIRMPNNCLEWTGHTLRGYGRMYVDGRRVPVHRLAWDIANGERVADGTMILHSCDNPPCCEPTHLRTGDAAANSADMISRGRAPWQTQPVTHCPQNHEYTEDNTYVNPTTGGRACKVCHLAAANRAYAKKIGRSCV